MRLNSNNRFDNIPRSDDECDNMVEEEETSKDVNSKKDNGLDKVCNIISGHVIQDMTSVQDKCGETSWQGDKIPQMDGNIEDGQNNSDSEGDDGRAPTLFNYRNMNKEEELLFTDRKWSEDEDEDEDVFEGEVLEKGDCEVCGNGGRRCRGCYRIHYCSQLCQKKDWKEHKPACVAHQAHIKEWGRH